MSQLPEIKVVINGEAAVIAARQKTRRLAAELGFLPTDLAIIATSVSELVRNILRYAGTGELVVRSIHQSKRRGIEIVARDEGPGIRDIDQAMQDGFSTSGGLGVGLPGVRRLMDEFDITSSREGGTVVKAKKWLPFYESQDFR